MAAHQAASPRSSTSASETEEQLEKSITDEIQIDVTALDEVVSVNSFFTAAMFIGLSLSNDKSLVAKGPDDPCQASLTIVRRLVLFEVLSFSCFLLSSLVAQALKLQLTICSARKDLYRRGSSSMVSTNPRLLRLGMLATALGTVLGTVFLMLSIINVIQLRLGMLSCDSNWSKLAAIPLIVFVSTGVGVFISIVLYAFLQGP